MSGAAQTSSVADIKARLLILAALGAVAILVSGTPVFRDSHGKSPTQYLDLVLQQGYRGWSGFHTCLHGPSPQHDFCWIEMHLGANYRLVEFDIDVSHSNSSPTPVSQFTWTRKPMPLSTPGANGTVNADGYDWGYIVQSVDVKKLPGTFLDVRGDATGFPRRMFLFRCAGSAKQVICVNALGDQIAYTPTATA